MNKIKEWIVSHKVITIVIASVLAVGIALSIALPLALACRHSYEWIVKTPAGYGVDMVKQEVCVECGDVKQSKTIADTKLESRKTLVMVNAGAAKLNTDTYHCVAMEAYILNGTLNRGDKLKVDGYDGELTVADIAKGEKASATYVESVDYNETEKIIIRFEEYIETEGSILSVLKNGAYVTKVDVPVQRYNKFTLNVTVPTDDGFLCTDGGQIRLCFDGGIELFGTIGDVVNTTAPEQSDLIPGQSGTLTITLDDEQTAVVWQGVSVRGVTRDSAAATQKTYFNGTVTGVLSK